MGTGSTALPEKKRVAADARTGIIVQVPAGLDF
jgi:hypothetical protein